MMPENIYSVFHTFNSESLRIAREYRGLKKNELANLLGVTPSAITQFESGQVKPTAQNIGQLSLALRFPVNFFGKISFPWHITSDHCHFRSLRSSTQLERRRMVSAGNLMGTIISFIEKQGIEGLPQERVSNNLFHGVETFDEIEEAALLLRKNWGLGLGPINNVIHLLEHKGVFVFRLLENSKSLDAFSLWVRHRPIIFLNIEKDSSSRSRFDAAHELGHLVMHSDYLAGDKNHEDQANRFASAFLLPRESFLQECPRRLVWDHFKELKKRWKVSLAALVRRARDLDVISEDTYRRANVQIGKNQWRTGEPLEPEIEIPTILPQAIGLLEEIGISTSKIAESISISKPDLLRLIYADREQPF